MQGSSLRLVLLRNPTSRSRNNLTRYLKKTNQGGSLNSGETEYAVSFYEMKLDQYMININEKLSIMSTNMTNEKPAAFQDDMVILIPQFDVSWMIQ